MTANAEQILDDTVEVKKLLGLTRRFEATHLPFPLAGRLMRNLSAIVRVAVHAMCDVAEGGSHCSRVAPEPVSNKCEKAPFPGHAATWGRISRQSAGHGAAGLGYRSRRRFGRRPTRDTFVGR